MVSGAHKLWINPILRAGPPPMLRRSLFDFDESELDEPLPHALTGRRAKAVRFKTMLLAVARVERFVGVPEPAVFLCVSV